MTTYRIHANARTTPKILREIQESDLSIAQLAEKYNISHVTVIKWRQRRGEEVEDRSHRPKRLRTTLTPVQEQVILLLREELKLSLDDLTAIAKQYINPNASRSAIDRLLRREGVPSLRQLMAQEQGEQKKAFKVYEPGFIHVNIKYLPQFPDQDQRSYLFVAIDHASRWVYWETHPDKEAKTAAAFLDHLVEACPFKITKVLTDNGKEFTDRFTAQAATDQRHGGALNGRIAEILKQAHFASLAEFTATLQRYTSLYLHHIPQRALNDWYEKKPNLFKSTLRTYPNNPAC